LLIFDEVITGFRLGLGGAQDYFGVMPDLTCLGKVIGGGLPVGAFGGRKEILQMLSPEGPVYQAGTLSGNPLAMAAGLATLKEVSAPGFFKTLNEKGESMSREIQQSADHAGLPVHVQGIGSMFTVFFRSDPIEELEGALQCDLGRFSWFHRFMLEHGIYWPPSQFEACFVSSAHTDIDLEVTLKTIREAFKSINKSV
jgi:glutamate-1-semialdehyde 2,1-aminomutase